jgi:branched-chain amino acid transport system permease protein
MTEAIIINGLISGGIYAILAIGFSLIFGVAKILNMAHTAFYMITGYFIHIVLSKLGVSLFIADITAVILTVLVAIICYQLFFDRVKEQHNAVMIISIALAMLFQEIFSISFGSEHLSLPSFITGYVELIGGVRVTWQHIIALGFFILAIILMWILLQFTKLGKTIRVVSEDREIANLMGINVSNICLITIGISSLLAGLAGVFVIPLFSFYPTMWSAPLVVVLAAVVLGGLGSIWGSILGAFILGFAETIVTFAVPMGSFLGGAVSLIIMIFVLLIRPEGLFGVVFEGERL